MQCHRQERKTDRQTDSIIMLIAGMQYDQLKMATINSKTA